MIFPENPSFSMANSGIFPADRQKPNILYSMFSTQERYKNYY